MGTNPNNLNRIHPGITTSSPVTISGLANQPYYFEVTAVNAGGEGDASSDDAIPYLPPATFRATAGDRQATLTWFEPTTNGSPITEYVIRYGGH